MKLEQYLDELAWPVAELSRRTSLSPRTIGRVQRGEPVFRHTVATIAKSLSQALGRPIKVEDIEGVNIK